MRRPGPPAPQLRREAARESPALRRPLNDALSALAASTLAAGDGGARVYVLGPVDFQTAVSPVAGSAPYPIRLTLPERATGRLAGWHVLRVENADAPGLAGAVTSAVSAWCESTGDGALLVQLVAGLAGSTNYRLTLGVTYA